MSSWSDAPPRSRILRGPAVAPAVSTDVSIVRSPAARGLVVDPALVDQAVEEGYRAGFDAGFRAGLEDSAAQVRAHEQARAGELQAVVARLAAAAEDLMRSQQRAAPDLENQVVAAALVLGEALVGFELTHVEERGRHALARALELAPEHGAIVARLNPDDLAALGDPALLAPGRALQIAADPSLRPGDCLVEVADSRIDARVATAVARVLEMLAS